jgi:hypothetical protein
LEDYDPALRSFLLKVLFAIERALQAELTGHPGYEKNDPPGDVRAEDRSSASDAVDEV